MSGPIISHLPEGIRQGRWGDKSPRGEPLASGLKGAVGVMVLSVVMQETGAVWPGDGR